MLFTLSWIVIIWIHSFLEGISTMWNANSFVRDLNFDKPTIKKKPLHVFLCPLNQYIKSIHLSIWRSLSLLSSFDFLALLFLALHSTFSLPDFTMSTLRLLILFSIVLFFFLSKKKKRKMNYHHHHRHCFSFPFFILSFVLMLSNVTDFLLFSFDTKHGSPRQCRFSLKIVHFELILQSAMDYNYWALHCCIMNWREMWRCNGKDEIKCYNFENNYVAIVNCATTQVHYSAHHKTSHWHFHCE